AEKIVRGTLADIKRRCQDEKIASQAMILASPALGARLWPDLARSKLYDPGFSHRFRKAPMPAAAAGIATGETA
ncbi:MAG TPA: precorrin-4 C(11)-methyltransferase, partial [Thauera aminoaromatica]|nr:precorrin-4 C(11)-methyltransferase [Thauera aminoaromatica]HNF00256.1 precorrin-4 C(11)-methyltransferase [Thauera aminoaromatica]